MVLKTGLDSPFLGFCLLSLLGILLSVFPLSICIWSPKERMQRRKITGSEQQFRTAQGKGWREGEEMTQKFMAKTQKKRNSAAARS